MLSDLPASRLTDAVLIRELLARLCISDGNTNNVNPTNPTNPTNLSNPANTAQQQQRQQQQRQQPPPARTAPTPTPTGAEAATGPSNPDIAAQIQLAETQLKLKQAELELVRAQADLANASASGSRPPVPSPSKDGSLDNFVNDFQEWAVRFIPNQLEDSVWQFRTAVKEYPPGAQDWLADWRREQKQSGKPFDLTELLRDFLNRFDPKVRTKEDEALEQLLEGQVRMDPAKGVAEYNARFREIARRAKFTDSKALAKMFRKGLIRELQAQCRVDSNGNEFANLTDLVDYAIGEEKKLKARAQGQSRASLHYAASGSKKRSRNSRQDANDNGKRPSTSSWVEAVNKRSRQDRQGHNRDSTAANQARTDEATPARPGRVMSKAMQWAFRMAEEKPNEPSNVPNPLVPGTFLTNKAKFEWMDQGRCFKCGQQAKHIKAACPGIPQNPPK
ncbi:hypothetical protein PLESTB_001749700 [Pleodorina starrii]|uniref:Retrotransposon gag domain-containing protein n=1 Tax=Pleodorina starrii TaxID=330485 RepID=A0A9W6F9L1_9CHLO|nr:hypothetical protein PLESTB_001749700 [Pleodorina starrii]